MSYILKIKKDHSGFSPLVRLIEHVRLLHASASFSTDEAKKYISSEYNIHIGEYDPEEQYTAVDFDSEQNYVITLLRWS